MNEPLKYKCIGEMVQRSRCGGGNWVSILDYDAAQSELAALREELAKSQVLSVTNIMMDVVPGFDGMGEEIYAKSVAEIQLLISNLYLKSEEADERLAAAEQRNARYESLLRQIIPCLAMSTNTTAPTYIRQIIGALPQPTESGASE